MKPISRGLLATALAAMLLAGCATQQPSPSVVDRASDRDAGQLMGEAESQSPAEAARTRLKAAHIVARQGNRERAYEITDNLDESALSADDRVRWALLHSELGRALEQPRAVTRAARVLDDELAMSSEQQKTLIERRRWARQALDQPDLKSLAVPGLAGRKVERIAVFLPESGPLSNVADTLKTAMQTHQDISGDSTSLRFFDTSQASLSELYEQARAMDAQIVIGPLSKDSVTRLEQRGSVPLPTLALNYGESDHNQARQLFQYGLSAENEARQVAKRASEEGHRQMSLMVPDNSWGQRVGEAFLDAWQNEGGSVANAIRYNPEGNANSAVKKALSVSGERARLDNIDGLFLLAVPEYARQVPSLLDYYYASELPTYATSHLHEGIDQPRQDKNLDGINFVDIPWQIPDAAVGGEEALPFYNSYRALSDDADASMFRLLAMGVDAYEAGTRLADINALQNFQGATGQLYLTADGRIYRKLPWAQFQNGVPGAILSSGPASSE
ncbi:penicillin-binding protein activator [Halomonas piscis]|uniref:penicillin-binding protein activator n=1 Tax=Halomonas piscis TaxID=3031727 RepID=UPI00289E09E9|nr:penicillin-binding protein activator [Halomonas piscis]